MKWINLCTLILLALVTRAQTAGIEGRVTTSNGSALPYANIALAGKAGGTNSNDSGFYRLSGLTGGNYVVLVSFVGYNSVKRSLRLAEGEILIANFVLESDLSLDQVVVTGTLKEVSRLESPVAVESYSPIFFKKNPSPSIYESMQNVNGVRPQLNCNVCNTGDIHINGMEGPYTMILIDGMPIVSGLSTVYGLTGIPTAMIERVEIVKGPASSLYGSEAIGGLINIITKSPLNQPLFTAEIQSTSWGEMNADLGFKFHAAENVDVLSGISAFGYANPIDHNDDNFTDISLSKRISVFQKWNFHRSTDKIFNIAARYYNEERWGGQMQWTTEERGSDRIYGESINTRRYELISTYQLPLRETVFFSTSLNGHIQDSYYGTLPFMANQYIGYSQIHWLHPYKSHDLTAGLAFRSTYYDDNTTATETATDSFRINHPSVTLLPGFFVQDEISISPKQKLLAGLRHDYHSAHGHILTPRIAYKFTFNSKNILRLNAGTGFRVVNIFTEDHAALTGSRKVVITEDLDPEKSYNVNVNFVRKFYLKSGSFIGLDMSTWYSRFTNKIIADYDYDPDLILYKNLDGYALSRGFTLNIDAALLRGFKVLGGVTFVDLFSVELQNGFRKVVRPVLTEKWSGTWAVSYTMSKSQLVLDYTGNLYGPMRLPLLGDLDPRAEYSPWWSIQNIQITYAPLRRNWELFGGIKNILNFTPPSNSIARSKDPFDKNVIYNQNGKVIPTPQNPYALTFDPSYVYAPNQGIRAFIGFRFKLTGS